MGPNAALSYSIGSDAVKGIVQVKVTAGSWSSNVIRPGSKNPQVNKTPSALDSASNTLRTKTSGK